MAAGVESPTGKTAFRRLMCNFLLVAPHESFKNEMVAVQFEANE